MKLGDWELTTVSGGRFRLDGGTLFSVVPKVLWTRQIVPDELNRVPQNTNCLLIRTGEANILIDTGYGSKQSAKQRKLRSADEGFPLLESLEKLSLTASEIDVVILTHLHFDHAGGVTQRNDAGELQLTFPNAEHVVQQGEWEIANSNSLELKGMYLTDDFERLRDSSQLKLIDGDVELVPGLSLRVAGGHTQHHQTVVLERAGETAVYAGDLIPSHWHLPTAWCMGYDLNQLETRRNKRALLQEVIEKDAWLLFDHDPEYAAVKLAGDPDGDISIQKSLTAC